MSNKRKDNKGRVLHSGEYQQANGRYRYKYFDGTGKARYLYSWRLDKMDRMPEGKRNGPSLREKIKDLMTTQLYNIAMDGGNLTVLELVKRYTATKIGVRESTKAGNPRQRVVFVRFQCQKKWKKHFGQSSLRDLS